MKLLFCIDTKDYDPNGFRFYRPSSRGIIIKDGLVGLIHSLKYNYYKFPGGGIEINETKEEALIREVSEEAGLVVIPSSIKEYGYIHRIQKGKIDDVFIQDNYYFICNVEDVITKQKLESYEAKESFTLEFVKAEVAINVNRNCDHGPKDDIMISRDAIVLEMLLEEGYLD